MLSQRRRRNLRKQKGMASVEMIPILMLFVLLVNFAMGFFGVIHSGILNSIAARNYAFETFRNRSSLVYLRDESGAQPTSFYSGVGFRFHSVLDNGVAGTNLNWVATKRPIKFTEANGYQAADDGTSEHNSSGSIRKSSIDESQKTSESMNLTGTAPGDDKNGVDPVWIMTSYGICLTAACGG